MAAVVAPLAVVAGAVVATSPPAAASSVDLHSAIPATATTDLPTVNMELVVIASQVEPKEHNQPAIGDGPSTTLVQKALKAKGYPISADGWFGNQTATAYSKWQRKLGFSGLGANGIPGPISLAKLSTGAFAVSRKIIVGARTTYSGKTVNARTKAMLSAADSRLGWPLTLSQGSYHPGEDVSKGTHDGGGVVDISVASMNTTQRWRTVNALRTVGFAAWLRSPAQGPWTWHIHAVAIGDTDLSIPARDQVADYYVGKNGLAVHAADNTPRQYRAPFTWWEKYRR